MFEKGVTIADVNRIFDEGKNALSSHFAELRSNILLDSGFHHNRKDRFRDGRNTRNRSKRPRMTKNHIQRINRHIENNILNANPGCGFFPRHERELSHQKAAELTDSVWQYQREKISEDQMRKELCHDFVVCGEAFLKVAWDANAGDFLGYEETKRLELEDPDDEDYEIKLDAKWSGKLVWERIFPFDVITDPSARSWDACRWVAIRKLIPLVELKAQYRFDPDKSKMLQEASITDTYQVFDGLTGRYTENKEHCLVVEMYVKPCMNYENGIYLYFTKEGILESGTLPTSADGKNTSFPIRYVGYDQSNTSVRSFATTKQIKHLQMEINRASSAVVMESLILGHSTVLTQAGSKLSSAGIGNGMKTLTYSGVKPDIIRGSNGDQYLAYIEQLTREMYELAQVPYREQDKATNANDTMGLLFRSLKDKKSFSYYAEKFERFLTEATKLSVELCRIYMTEDELIPMVGSNERVNISEFKNDDPLCTIVKTRPRTDDFVSMMGKSIQVSQILQYAGSTLSASDVGVLARNLPFLNDEQIIEDSVLDYDLANNTILALDRGESPAMSDAEDHKYMIRRLTNRMKKPDFIILPPNVKQAYQDRLDQHNKFWISQQQEAAMATAGFIPAGGGLIAADMYVTKDNGKQQRARFPAEALHWLATKLSNQGTQLSETEELPLSAQASVGRGMQQAAS